MKADTIIISMYIYCIVCYTKTHLGVKNEYRLEGLETITYLFIAHSKTCNTHSRWPFCAASIKGVLPLLSVKCSNSRICVLLSRTYVRICTSNIFKMFLMIMLLLVSILSYVTMLNYSLKLCHYKYHYI